MVGMQTRPMTDNVKTIRSWMLNFVIALSALFLFLIYEATMT